MIGSAALGQLALGQLPLRRTTDPQLGADSTLLTSARVIGVGLSDLVADSSLIVTAFVLQPYLQPIINGWYVDSKGGIHYYYRTPDGRNLPPPPVSI